VDYQLASRNIREESVFVGDGKDLQGRFQHSVRQVVGAALVTQQRPIAFADFRAVGLPSKYQLKMIGALRLRELSLLCVVKLLLIVAIRTVQLGGMTIETLLDKLTRRNRPVVFQCPQRPLVCLVDRRRPHVDRPACHWSYAWSLAQENGE
jgi:hypothetical protein